MNQKDLTASGLSLSVARGPVDESSLTIYATRTGELGLRRFRVCVLGESHLVQISEKGKVVLTEVLACANFGTNGLYHYQSMAERDRHTFIDNLLGYQIDVDRMSLQSVVAPAEIGNVLVVRFPETHGAVPFTSIEWELHSRIFWHTIHVYPLPSGRVEVVRTRSAIFI